MTAQTIDTDTWEVGESREAGPFLVGMYPVTLVAIGPPVKRDEPNEWGKTPTTRRFSFVADGYDYEFYSYPAVDTRHEKSNFAKIFKALTGQALTRQTDVAAARLIGRRCNGIFEESTKYPGSSRLTGFARIAPAPQPQRPAPQPAAAPAQSELDEFADVPF